MSEYNPFSAPESFGETATEAARTNQYYGGIRRLPYFGYGFLLNVVIRGVQGLAEASDAPGLALLMVPVSLVGAIALAYQRCQNIGMNPWWSLGIIVPLLNIFVGLRCIAYPEGYEDHKTLDTPAKVLIGIFIVALALILLGVVFLVANLR